MPSFSERNGTEKSSKIVKERTNALLLSCDLLYGERERERGTFQVYTDFLNEFGLIEITLI